MNKNLWRSHYSLENSTCKSTASRHPKMDHPNAIKLHQCSSTLNINAMTTLKTSFLYTYQSIKSNNQPYSLCTTGFSLKIEYHNTQKATHSYSFNTIITWTELLICSITYIDPSYTVCPSLVHHFIHPEMIQTTKFRILTNFSKQPNLC